MILFAGDTPRKVLMGQKTQTRRCWKRRRVKPGAFHWAQLNMRADSRFARLKIIDVWTQDPNEITPDHIRAEGFATFDEFLLAYMMCNPTADQDVRCGEREHYVIDFVVHEVTALGEEMLRNEYS